MGSYPLGISFGHEKEVIFHKIIRYHKYINDLQMICNYQSLIMHENMEEVTEKWS